VNLRTSKEEKAMSRKLVSKIQDIKGLPAKHKRVLEGWAAFANNDGTNIFASKESVAEKKSISKWTVFRNTEDLVAAGVLVEAKSHKCKTKACTQGEWHYAGNGTTPGPITSTLQSCKMLLSFVKS
jgi:hypothetical protein